MESTSVIRAAVPYRVSINARSLIPVFVSTLGEFKISLTASRDKPLIFFFIVGCLPTFFDSERRYTYLALLDERYFINVRKEETRLFTVTALLPRSVMSHIFHSSICFLSKQDALNLSALIPQ